MTDPSGPTAWYGSPWRIAARAVSGAGLTLLLVLVAALVVVPQATGGATLTVLTGSMEPTLRPGDVIVVRGTDPADVCRDVPVGAVVTVLPFPDDPTLVTHRVVAKTAGSYPDGTRCRLVTRGDANSADDDPVSPVQVRGVLLYAVPRLGLARQWAATHPGLLLTVGGATLVAAGLWSALRRPRTRVVGAAPDRPPVAPPTEPHP